MQNLLWYLFILFSFSEAHVIEQSDCVSNKGTVNVTKTLQVKSQKGKSQKGNINRIRKKSIPRTRGNMATLTYFTDTVFQCISSSNPPPTFALAVNPLLLGFTVQDWNTRFSNADPSKIPWCGKTMKVTVNNKSFTGTIIDTCNPGAGGEFTDPNTGEIIGGSCDYADIIDLHGQRGLEFLRDAVGDDFYSGELQWEIIL